MDQYIQTSLLDDQEVGHWISVKDGDTMAYQFYEKHYSSKKYKDNRRGYGSSKRFLFVGPGKKIVLFGRDGLSLFAWRYGEDNSQGLGVYCTIFRNDGSALSSSLITEADQIAWRIWPEMNRHITYVDPKKIKSVNPGYCFKMAGWKKFGLTKGGLVILDIYKNEQVEMF